MVFKLSFLWPVKTTFWPWKGNFSKQKLLLFMTGENEILVLKKGNECILYKPFLINFCNLTRQRPKKIHQTFFEHHSKKQFLIKLCWLKQMGIVKKGANKLEWSVCTGHFMQWFQAFWFNDIFWPWIYVVYYREARRWFILANCSFFLFKKCIYIFVIIFNR